jgi:CheY-like chemotaxis protein
MSSMNTAQILLVDDDPALLQALPHLISLRMSGVQIQTAAEASIALSLLQEQEYDAIVSDIKMPGMDGLELLARISERYPESTTWLFGRSVGVPMITSSSQLIATISLLLCSERCTLVNSDDRSRCSSTP